MPSWNFVIGPYTYVVIGGVTYPLIGSQNVQWTYNSDWNYYVNQLIQTGPQKVTIRATVVGDSVPSSPQNSTNVVFTHQDGHTLTINNMYVRSTAIADQKEGLMTSVIELYTENLGSSQMVTGGELQS